MKNTLVEPREEREAPHQTRTARHSAAHRAPPRRRRAARASALQRICAVTAAVLAVALVALGGYRLLQNRQAAPADTPSPAENLTPPEDAQPSPVLPSTPISSPGQPSEPDGGTAPEADGGAEDPNAGDPPAAEEPPLNLSFSREDLGDEVAKTVEDIITDGMSDMEKARAIFDFAHDNIRYTGDSDKSDWEAGAYEGLTKPRRDCFTYYAVSRALLTAVGIDNLEVTRVGGPTSHYWNLIDCGSGWYHFDATPRSSKMPHFVSFMFTDQEAADYTAKAGRNYYTFDGSLYPERATEDDPAGVNTKKAGHVKPAEENPPAQTEPAQTDPAQAESAQTAQAQTETLPETAVLPADGSAEGQPLPEGTAENPGGDTGEVLG